MKAYIIKNQIQIEPFFEDSETLLIGNKCLKSTTKRILGISRNHSCIF